MAERGIIDKGVLKKIEETHSSLIITHGGSIQDVVSSIVKYFTDKDYTGLYLSLNKPHRTIESILRKAGVSTKNLYYIDCITASIHSVDKKKAPFVVYFDHPKDLSQKKKILDVVDEFALSVPDKKFFVVDALRTILIYHEPEIVSELVGDLIREFQDLNIKFIVLTRSEDEKEVIDGIAYHFDAVLEV